jgi:hypothetical protein
MPRRRTRIGDAQGKDAMRKALTLLVSLGLGISASAGIAGLASAQDTITSDGGYVTANDDSGDSSVEGGGTDIVYGDVSTGNTGGDVLGDPGAIYYPDLSSVPSPSGEPWSPTIVGIPVGNPGAGDMIDGIDVSIDFSMSQAPASGGVVAEGSSASSEGETIVVDDTAMPVE